MTYDDYLDHSVRDHMKDPDWWHIYQNIEPYLNEDVETKNEALESINRLIDELYDSYNRIVVA